MKDKYNKLMLDTYDKSFKVKCEMIYLVSNLKNNKSSIYKVPVSEYCEKEYDIFKYLVNFKIKSYRDIVYCNFLIKLSRGYLRVLYYKFLDMYDLQYKRLYDSYESVSYKKKYNRKKYVNKYSKELIDKYNYINVLFKVIFKNINILIKINNLMLINNKYDNIDNYYDDVVKLIV